LLETQKVKTNDIETYFKKLGSGETMVFLHALCTDYNMWNKQTKYFSKKYATISYDLRGHGKTGGSKIKEYDLNLFSDDLKALLDKFGVDKVVLCGLSFGGMIAQRFALKYPERLKALILADTLISPDLLLSTKIYKYLLSPKFVMNTFVRSLKRFTNESIEIGKLIFGKKALGIDKGSEKYYKETLKKISVEELRKLLMTLYNAKLINISEIKIPTLIITGEYDMKLFFDNEKAIKKMVKNSKAVCIPDAGHLSNMENPKMFNKEIKSFLEKIN